MKNKVAPQLSKEAILEVAAKLFREEGYRATSLEDVAAYFNVSRQALYYYFTSKQEILTTIHRQLGEKLYSKAWELFDAPLPVEQKMQLMLRNLILIMATDATSCGIFYEEEKEIDPVFFNEVRMNRRKYTEKMIKLYTQGVKEKVFYDVDPKIAVFAMLGACNWVYRWFREEGAATAEEIADIIAGVLANGYLSRGGEGRVSARRSG
jgi:AcrR family transcriptional regulator